MSNRDVNGAFRLLWLDPGDVELFATTLPPHGWTTSAESDEANNLPMLLMYLVLSFGGSGSPGEWTPWAWGILEYLAAYRPSDPCRDGRGSLQACPSCSDHRSGLLSRGSGTA